jgi:pilus assembly protein CpaC
MKISRGLLVGFYVLVWALIVPMISNGQDENAPSESTRTEQVLLSQNKDFQFDYKFNRVSLADPEIAEVAVLNPTRINVTGKSLGKTSLTLSFVDAETSEQRSEVITIEVVADLTHLKNQIKKYFPKETDIMIEIDNTHLVLSGKVSNSDISSHIKELAEIHFPGKVLNFLQVKCWFFC